MAGVRRSGSGSTAQSNCPRRRMVVDRSIHSCQTPIASLNLRWIPFTGSAGTGKRPHRKKSKAWEFMGQLVHTQNNDAPDNGDASLDGIGQRKLLRCLISDLLYCRMCFEDQMNAVNPTGVLSKVYCTAQTTSSGNHLAHAAARHGKYFDRSTNGTTGGHVTGSTGGWSSDADDLADGLGYSSDVEPAEVKLENLLADDEPTAATGGEMLYDFDADLVVLLCKDLRSASTILDAGFRQFCDRHVGFELPTPSTLMSTSVPAVYGRLKNQVVDLLASTVGGTVMLDRWKDVGGRCLLAVCFGFVRDWTFDVVTLAVGSVDDHSPGSLVTVVKDALDEFLPAGGRRCVLFDTTDGGVEMRQLSKLLGHDRIDCVGRSIDRLLTTDGVGRVADFVRLFAGCRRIVDAVHGRGHLAAGRVDVRPPDDVRLFERIADVHELLMLDEIDGVWRDEGDPDVDGDERGRISCIPSRWSVMLTTLQTVLDLHRPIVDVLKRIDQSDLCLDEADVELATQLRRFLSPFEQFTLLVSECSPNLSLVPLLRTRIQKMCSPADADCQAMVDVKRLVADAVDRRLPVTDAVRLNVCFDPAVRDVVLSHSDCKDLLTSAYRQLRSRPGLAKLFASSCASSAAVAGPSGHDGLLKKEEDGTVNGASAAKRLRLSLLMESTSTLDSAPAVDNGINDEIRRYMAVHDEEPALEFWKSNAESFPLLSTMARIYLAFSPGSVRFDCLFSTKGLGLNSRRSNLPPYCLSMMSFIHDNCD